MQNSILDKMPNSPITKLFLNTQVHSYDFAFGDWLKIASYKTLITLQSYIDKVNSIGSDDEILNSIEANDLADLHLAVISAEKNTPLEILSQDDNIDELLENTMNNMCLFITLELMQRKGLIEIHGRSKITNAEETDFLPTQIGRKVVDELTKGK